MGLGRIDLSDKCQQFVTTLAPAGSTVLELGSGFGTKVLVKSFTVYSVEQSAQWVGHCPESNYIYAPIVNGWYDRNVLAEQLPKEYDILIIDGPGGTGRSKFLDNLDLFPLLNQVPIIVDDANRPEEKELLEGLSKHLNKPFQILAGDIGTAYILP